MRRSACAQRLLGPLPLGDVHADADHPGRLAAAVREDLPLAQHPADRAVGPGDAELNLVARPLLQRAVDRPQGRVPVLGVDQVPERLEGAPEAAGGRPWTSSRLTDQATSPVRRSQSQVPIRPASSASRSRSSASPQPGLPPPGLGRLDHGEPDPDHRPAQPHRVVVQPPALPPAVALRGRPLDLHVADRSAGLQRPPMYDGWSIGLCQIGQASWPDCIGEIVR